MIALIYFASLNFKTMVLKVNFGSGVESYTVIGDDFNIVFKESAPDEFARTANLKGFGNDPVDDAKVFAFITYNGGSEIRPLYNTQYNAILSNRAECFIDLGGYKTTGIVSSKKDVEKWQIDKVNEMCQSSLPPKEFKVWEGIRGLLLQTRNNGE